MKKCIACAMPMNTPQDFAMADISKDYCAHCARPDGSMQSYDEKLESMTGFIIKTQGFDLKAARETAKTVMSRLPAWI
ncbi:MAG: zinc ribbon domain-containing protein, partial [Brevinematales bacterium]